MLLAHFKAKCDCVKSEDATESELLLLTGGNEPMKYRGITIKKHTTCNTWYARYRANGKQFYVSAKTQKECYNKLKNAIKKIEQNNNKLLKENKTKTDKCITFFEWFNKWIKLYKQNVKDTTKQDYQNSLKYVDIIFKKDITKITNLEILELINKIPFERRKQKTYELLKAIFEKAKINRVVYENPLDFIDKPKHKKTNGIALSNEDEILLEKILIEKKLDCFLICLYQGLRKGEMLALNIEDLDFKNKTITINKSMSQNNKISQTKNIYSDRVIPMFENTYNLLLKYKNKTGRLFEISLGFCEDNFLKIKQEYFPNKKYTIHSLRHTFITKCQEANIPLHITQGWVGHNIGSEVTSRVYTHARENAMKENINQFNNYINKP